MRKLMLAAAVAALFATPSQAVTFLGSTLGPDSNVPAGVLIDFNSSVAGLTGNYHLVTGTVSSQYAQPFGGGTQYLSVPQTGSSGQATLDLSSYGLSSAVDGFSFYWGSIDTYNSIKVQTSANANYTFAFDGSNPPPPANGDQSGGANNRRVYFGLDGGETIQSLTFISNGIAFEVDDLVFTSTVPEPATWAMMIAGFGLVGGTLRSRKRESDALAA